MGLALSMEHDRLMWVHGYQVLRSTEWLSFQSFGGEESDKQLQGVWPWLLPPACLLILCILQGRAWESPGGQSAEFPAITAQCPLLGTLKSSRRIN